MAFPVIANIRDRHAILLEVLAAHPEFSVYKAGKIAGFADTTMRKQGKKVLNTALKRQAALAEAERRNDKEIATTEYSAIRDTVASRLGVEREEMEERFRYLALETKRDDVSLKAITPLLRDEYGYDPVEQTDAKQPVINIVMQEPTVSLAPQQKEGLVES